MISPIFGSSITCGNATLDVGYAGYHGSSQFLNSAPTPWGRSLAFSNFRWLFMKCLHGVHHIREWSGRFLTTPYLVADFKHLFHPTWDQFPRHAEVWGILRAVDAGYCWWLFQPWLTNRNVTLMLSNLNDWDIQIKTWDNLPIEPCIHQLVDQLEAIWCS